MSEDAGKKNAIRDFLYRVSNGLGFIEDIWIEREVRAPGAGDIYCTAKSLSNHNVTNLTQLLEGDIKHCFEDNYFTFRLISAQPGSGKTSLLTYLLELIKLRKEANEHSLTSLLSLNDILSIGGTTEFSIKLYSYILGITFWNLFRSENKAIQQVRDNLLSSFFSDSEIGALKIASEQKKLKFKFHWNQLIQTKPLMFEDFFFEVIEKITDADSQFTFVYLIDELDALTANASYANQAPSFFRSLINKAHSQEYEGKLRLMIYLVGTSGDANRFLQSDPALMTRIVGTKIELVSGTIDEFERIKLSITGRIHNAYKGCKDFPQAWQEINDINLSINSDYKSLREFCQRYASKVSEIHEKSFVYFDVSFNLYERKARQLIESEARRIWSNQLIQRSYSIKSSESTTVIKGHAFDGYTELLHNGIPVARAYGEAKNYELLSSHLGTFEQWLQDVEFNSESNPTDLAFLVAPSCAFLLSRKIKLKNITFLQQDKIEVEPTSIEQSIGIDINSASQTQLIGVFKGTGVYKSTIEKILKFTANQKFSQLEELCNQMRFTPAIRKKLEEKLKGNEIYFSS